jgi:hypothetical protein
VPENRVQEQADGTAMVKAEPVYLDVRAAKQYQAATLEMDIQNSDEQLLQAGLAVVGEGDWSFFLKPLQHRQLDQLAWPKLEQGNLTLWQKYPRFSSIAEFLASSTSRERVATFNYKLDQQFKIAGYHEPAGQLVIDRTLRGPIEMATYVSTGKLELAFDIQDINRTVGPDPAAVYVRSADGRHVYSGLLADDGRAGDRVGASPRRTLSIAVPNLAEGTYFVDLRMDQDLFVRRIVSSQHKLIFREHLYVADSAEYSDGFTDMNLSPTVLVTNGHEFLFRTAHPAGYQTVQLNGRPVAQLQARHSEYSASSTTPMSTIRTPLNDVQIETDGWIAFSHDQFFNPSAYTVEQFPQLTAFDYLLADYKPGTASGWRHVSATFNLADASRTNGRIRFLISNIEPTAGEGKLRIGRVTITLSKPKITGQIFATSLARWLSSWL